MSDTTYTFDDRLGCGCCSCCGCSCRVCELCGQHNDTDHETSESHLVRALQQAHDMLQVQARELDALRKERTQLQASLTAVRNVLDDVQRERNELWLKVARMEAP